MKSTRVLNNRFNILALFGLAASIFFACSGSEGGLNNGRQKFLSEAFEKEDYKEMTVSEFVSWYSVNSLRLTKSKSIAEMEFSLSYLPPPIMAFLELRKTSYDFEKFVQTSTNYSEMSYFNFKIEAPGYKGELLKYDLESPLQYDSRVKYLSFEMQNDICLIQKGDTLMPGLYHFERTFDVGPFVNVMFAFDNKKFDMKDEFEVVYNDKVFDKGLVKFTYKNKQLIRLPNIIGI